MTTTVLSEKIAELVALGAAIAATCQPCLTFHLRVAREAGASDDEIQEALTIGRAVRQTPARLIDEAANRATGTTFVAAEASPTPCGNGDGAAAPIPTSTVTASVSDGVTVDMVTASFRRGA